MGYNRNNSQVLFAFALSLATCTGVSTTIKSSSVRDQAVQELQRQAGAPITLEANEAGTARVLAMTPRFPAPGHATDLIVVAQEFIIANCGVFQFDTADATQFAVTSVDNDLTTGLHHVTMNRTYNGIWCGSLERRLVENPKFRSKNPRRSPFQKIRTQRHA